MALEQAGVQLIAQGADAFNADLKSAMGATNNFVDATERGGGKVSGAGQVMIGAMRQVGSIAVEAFAKAARAAADFAGDSIKLAGDFESGMLNFQAVAGKDIDAKGLKEFRDLFIDIGKRLPVSTMEVQDAATELVKGGIEPATLAAGGLESSIKFASAAMDGDLTKAAEVSAKVVGGWASVTATAAEKADLMTHAQDQMTKAANASTVDVDELARGIYNAQGVFKTAGGTFDDLTVTLAALSPRFASASEAGNSFKNFMARLQPTTDAATDAMKGLGLITADGSNKFYDATGKFIGVQQASQLLQDSLKGLNEQQKQSVLQTIFGNDAMGPAAGLANLGAQGYQNMADAMDRANGVADAAALKQAGFNTSLDNAKGSVEALQITIGSFLLPVLGDLLDNYIAPTINAVTDFAESFFKMVPAIMASDDPLQTFLNALKVAAPQFTDAIIAIENFKDAVVGFATPIITEITRLSDAFNAGGLSGLVDTIVSDIESAIPDIESALLGWGQALIDWIAPYIPPMLDALGDAVDEAWAWVQDQVPGWIDQFGVWGAAFGDWVAPYIPLALDALNDLLDEAWAWVIDQAPGWGEQLQSWGNELLDWIAPMIPPVLDELGKLGQQLLDWIGAQAGALLKEFNTWATSFVAWIPGATVTFLAEWPKMFDQFLDWVGESAGPLLKQLGDWALSFIQWIAPMIPPFLAALGGVALAILAFVVETAATLSKKIIDTWLPAIVGWIITDAIPGLLKALNSFLEVFQGWIDDIQRDIARRGQEVGKAIIDGIKVGLSNAWGSLVGWLSSKMSGIVDAAMDAIGAHSPATAFMPVGEYSVLGIMQGFSDNWPRLTSLVGSLSEKMADDLISKMQNIGQDMQGAIADAFGATASIDRQIAKNLDRFKDVLPQYEQYTTGALKEAQQKAQEFLDPAEGAKFFKMRSDQILEYAKLQKDLDEAETQADRDRISAQMLLINKAQTAELSQFDANATAQESATQTIANSINDIMKSLAGINLTDDQIKIVDMLSTVWGQLQTPVQSRADAYAHPPMMQYPSGGPTTTSSTQNITMPIYTNNSPAALQQSWAVLQASMP